MNRILSYVISNVLRMKLTHQEADDLRRLPKNLVTKNVGGWKNKLKFEIAPFKVTKW